MEKLSPEQQRLAAKIFHYMVTPAGSKIAYSALELAGYARKEERNIDKEDLNTLSNKLKTFLNKLTEPDFRLLRTVNLSQPEGTYYEIFHDMYAKPILAWQARYEWEKMEREAEAEEKKRIEAAKKQANLIHREGEKRARHFKIQADLAKLHADKAEKRANRAEKQIQRAKQLVEQAKKQSRQAGHQVSFILSQENRATSRATS